jgi:hypothetical protein
MSNGVTLDFIGTPNPSTTHYAFLVDDAEFDASFAKIKKAGIPYYAHPDKSGAGEINHLYGGRGVYFEDPNGHMLELITKPYGDHPGWRNPASPDGRHQPPAGSPAAIQA